MSRLLKPRSFQTHMAEKLGKVPEGQDLGSRGGRELTSSEGTWSGKPSKGSDGLSSTGSLDRRTGMSSTQSREHKKQLLAGDQDKGLGLSPSVPEREVRCQSKDTVLSSSIKAPVPSLFLFLFRSLASGPPCASGVSHLHYGS